MKKIIKADAILTGVTAKYKKLPQDGTIRNPKWSYFSYYIDDKAITSENTLIVKYASHEGDHMTIWYVQNKPKRVYRYKLFAFLFG